MDAIDFIKRYLEHRDEAEWTLSKRVGSRSLIQSWRRGESRPRFGNVMKLVRLMDQDSFFADATEREAFINALLRLPTKRDAALKTVAA